MFSWCTVFVLEVRNPPRTVAGGPFVFIYVSCPEGHKHASVELNCRVSDACNLLYVVSQVCIENASQNVVVFQRKKTSLIHENQDSLTNRANQISGVSVSYLDTHLFSSIPARFRAEEDSRLLNAYKQQ